jgi:hypothetical protein
MEPRGTTLSVLMPVMQVRIVHVPMSQGLMAVPVRMFLCHTIVGMSMMLVVDMAMLVLHRFMRMVMAVSFGQMEKETEPHEQTRENELGRYGLA